MHSSALIFLFAPLLALANPIELAQRQSSTCCYRTTDGNGLIFVTNEGSGPVLDTLNWCFIDVQRDVSDPNNCAAATRSLSGYCTEEIGTEAIPCP
ncbi:hypothetical protein ACHAQH_010083 [Verticillium albo-atrum]